MKSNMEKINPEKTLYVVLLCFAFISVFSIVLFDGTGDAGDSIMHYLFARYAPSHPEHFLNLWAKPVFVVFAFPFAQLGFVGIKIFNALVVLFTLYFTGKSAIKLQRSHAPFAVLFMIFSPLYYILTFSGLTEPLFALFTSAILFLAVQQKWLLLAIITSFIPFVRSEGLIILGVVAIFYLYSRKMRFIPWLLTGHVLLTVAGYFYYHDWLWIFAQNPYARLSSTYGSGGLLHFVVKMPYVTGIPIAFLLAIGFLVEAWQIVRGNIRSHISILVWLGFSAYFAAHSLFFYLGIFNSMGLHRVMIGIMPLIGILSLSGFVQIEAWFLKIHRKAAIAISGIVLILVVVFPFLSNPAAVKWGKDMNLSIEQQNAQMISDSLLKNNPDANRWLYSHSYFGLTLPVDYFDEAKHQIVTAENISGADEGDIIIWDYWFAVVENGVSKSMLDQDSSLILLMETSQKGNGMPEFAAYRKD